MKCDILSLDNKKVGDVDLDETVFGAPVRTDILHRMVVYQLAKRQPVTHKTKNRSEVQGTTKKAYKQKGTGQARHGAIKAPQFRKGGTVFGPLVRSHAVDLPKKVRKLALRTALSSKQAGGKLVVLDKAELASGKTKDLAKKIKAFGWESALIVGGETLDGGFERASRNLIGIDVLPSQGANVYDILRRDTLVLTREAVDKLVERLK